MPPTASALSLFHPVLVAAVRVEAERAADRVANFFHGTADSAAMAPLRNRETLLELGAAFTLATWEQAGITVHREAGLPDARTAGRYALATAMPAVPRVVPSLMTQVLGVFVDRMAWSARAELGADVALDATDEDEEDLIDAVAQFVWARRHEIESTPRTAP